MFDTFIASFLVSGSVTWLYFSDRLLEFPLGVFGIALATVVLPNLSEAHYKKGASHFNQTIQWALKLSLLIAIPATIGLFLLSQPILVTLFQYGEFESNDSLMAAYSLMAYSLGLPAFILIKILATGFYARQDTKTPVRIGIQAMILNMVLNVLFVVSMLHYDFIAPHVGLALATSASAYFNAAMLAMTLKRDSIIESSETFALPVLKILIACSAMSLVILWLSPTSDSWAQWLWFDRVYQLALLIVPGFLCYTIMLWIMGLRRNQFAN